MLERRSVRRALVRRADRSEKVRTYNWAQVSFSSCIFSRVHPVELLQGRVTDHRINLTINNLDDVLAGNGLSHFIDALAHDHDTQALESLLEDG